jgi:cell shape-determining protein MreC
MYNNIGKKIKALAKILCIVIAVFWIVIGFVLIFGRYSSPFVRLIGFLTAIVGPFFAWVSSFLLYGYGVLIEQNAEIKRAIKRLTKGSREKEETEKKIREEEEEKEKEKMLFMKTIMEEKDIDNEETSFYNPMSEE